MKKTLALCLVCAAAALSAAPQQPPTLSDVLNSVNMRNIGPFRSGSWVTAIAVPDTPAREHLYTIYAAERSGGLWKTTNAGTTWTPVSDQADIGGVGAVAIASTDSKIVWLGTGDQANARSSNAGNGVYKSVDAGATWQSMGLTDTQHIARIVIHPTNPNIVYVAAIGHLFSKNEERGVFKTIDGGKTWKKALYVNDGVGAIDLVINQKSPNVLYAAMYDKQRYPWQIIESGPETGVYRSDDGGEKWTRLTNGLPGGKIGRIGLDIYQKNPLIVYALLENQNQKAAAPGNGQVSSTSPLAQGIVGNELYRTDDGGRSWRKVSGDVNVAGGKAPYSFNQIKINPFNDQQVLVNSDNMFQTKDGGKTWSMDFMRGTFGDFRCMWWDAQDEDRVMTCSDGGVTTSLDRGKTGEWQPNIKAGEAYALGVDMDDPYHVYAGFQDHDSWKGPVNSRFGEITLEDWVTVGPGDGMYNIVDPTDSRWVYNTRELNSMGRMDQKTGMRTDISPGRANSGNPALRYNWIAPIAMSPHDPKTIYAGAQILFRSKDRGDHWEAISPDLTTNDPTKLKKNVPFCTITSISESVLTDGLIWVGTDDGNVQITRNAGGAWTNVTEALTKAGAPAGWWISRVFASPHNAGTAFVAVNGFRFDDFRPFLFKTTDYGTTWTSITSDLPKWSLNVVVQDKKNANLLYVGNDRGIWVSIDAGGKWTQLKANMPAVAVHDLTIHPRENDLVVATYGRALWTGDVSFMPEMTPAVLDSNAYLFDIKPKARYGFGSQGMNYELYGDRFLSVPNEPEAIVINYYLKADAPTGAKITITDASGTTVRSLDGPAKKGLNRALWPLNGGAGGRGGRGAGPAAAPPGVGTYSVTVEVAGEKFTKPAKIRERIGDSGSVKRIFSIDLLRGLIMAIMAIDHTREFVNISAIAFNVEDLTKTTFALFFTRWITHFCAPVFMFTAGLGAFLRLERDGSKGALAKFLFTRGLWLLFLELTIVRFVFFFDPSYSHNPIFLLVFWSIGMSMVALAGMIYLPFNALLAVSVGMIALHNLADQLTPDRIGVAPWLFNLFHRPGVVITDPVMIVGYPLIPWIGVIGIGFCFGRLYRLPSDRRRRVMIWMGLAMTLAFVALRFANAYGDPSHWTSQPRAGFTLLSFLRTTKYPPSLIFLLMTLGPAITFLGLTDRVQLKNTNPLIVFGRTPQFYFIVHLAVIHVFAIAMGWFRYGYQPFLFTPGPTIGGPNPLYPAGYGWSLGTTYLVWMAVLIAMYPMCRWLANLKATRRSWWLSYL